ncbi:MULTISPECIES: LLM class F420-dependent oxidoreductase [Streptomyces]|uniref:LLM class F420-dependent oxidoreductase n=1 Tax=Streptomyces lycii TaxID=2654337 RepID=A0ABQ7FKE4_9ACTN|nr:MULTISPECIES: LLM class F420-dependent oxidoreductase [Streptomyces]KAF4409127.1 LLM class F420-dependent oxidoreductase [Streptomyces lycii]PGH48081.1 LLM class F420-dependent oxidoreductase [Streptomyces sp. Ru87]
MDLRIFTEPQQGATYDTLLGVARATEELGFSAFFRSDHYLHMGDVDGLPGPTDAWITLAGLARETERIRLGTLMTAGTFRLPGVLAIQVAQVDQMSGGRIDFGLGSGWYAEEHSAYGIPFPKEKISRLEEQLEIITGLWSTPVGERFDYTGRYYELSESPALPKPAQPKVPVLVGGLGAKRTPALAARFADEFNVPFASPEDTGRQFGRVRAAAEERGRKASDLVYSNALVVCAGRDDAEVARRAGVIGREVDELRENGLCGSPAEITDKIGRYREAGSERIYLQVLDLSDLDQMELVASEVMPQLD